MQVKVVHVALLITPKIAGEDLSTPEDETRFNEAKGPNGAPAIAQFDLGGSDIDKTTY